MPRLRLVKLLVVAAFAACVGAALVTNNFVARDAYARSAGPEPGFTKAPGEFDCTECHLPDGAPTGSISISAPQTYIPGQTYPVTVTVSNQHPSRLRWGFQLTAVDDTGNRAGTLAAGADGRTQVITGALGTPARQYVEHTSAGTSQGQSGGAIWTFNWTAPAESVGPVLFYAAGNQANNDGNTSGDSINFTFVASQPTSPSGDFTVTVTPSSQVILPGGTGSYTVTVTPANGFTGTVDLNLAVEGTGPGLMWNFSPAAVQITDSTPRTSTLTFSPNSHALLGTYNLTVTATHGGLRRTAPFALVTGPTVLDPTVAVRIVMSGLDQPVGMALVGGHSQSFFVIEKATGKVKFVDLDRPGRQVITSLDLAVNLASERGLLGIALHPNFDAFPALYLYWTESTTGADTANPDETPLLGNRVDEYRFSAIDGRLHHTRNILRLRALQQDAGQPSRANHNGGVLRFGPDGKLYVLVGDLGRRGQMQNLRFGPSVSPSGPAVADDQFGGPEPDDEHLSGVVLRLNDDGSAPPDNPFLSGMKAADEAAVNIQKVFGYGIRNSFGMDFDPLTGFLWTQENGDDAFDEINRVTPGFNGGWIQLMGPSSRVAEFKQIETSRSGGLQQLRWPPERIADTPAEALARLYALPGSVYREPEFSWKFAVAPAAVGFVQGGSLGPASRDSLLVGASRPTLYGGYLFRMALDPERRGVLASHPTIADKVADNLDKFDATESAPFDFGRDFGVVTDIRSLPGVVYVVSLSHGAIYALNAKSNTLLFAAATFDAQEGAASATVTVRRVGDTSGTVSVDYRTADSNQLVPCADRSGTAFARCDYSSTTGTLTFAPGQTEQAFTVPLVNDAHDEDTEEFTVELSNPSGASLGALTRARVRIVDDDAAGAQNPLDTHTFFVRQHYLDFLSREPEPSGLQAWLDVLNNCPNAFNTDASSESARCDRVNVSSSFFRSAESELKGYFVYRFYRASLGRRPAYTEIAADMARVTGATAAEVTARRTAFATEWLARPEVAARYPATMTPEAFVDALLQTAGVSLSTPDPVSGATRDSLARDLRLGNLSRAEVLRTIVESREVDAKEFNGAFVAMQYFGYLRRDPEEPGYTDWLNYLNANPTDFRTMVNGFVNSREYRLRFGPAD